MSTDAHPDREVLLEESYPIYPAYAFRSSPTHFSWVRMSGATFQRLRQESGFEGQKLYFYLNHPIQYVCAVAPVVEIDAIRDKRTLRCKMVLLTLDDGSGQNLLVKMETTSTAPEEPRVGPETIQCPVSNVSLRHFRGDVLVAVNGRDLKVGDVLKVKGAVSQWKDGLQLELKRIRLVPTTGQEVKEWADLARWHDVISKPWILSGQKLKQLEQEDSFKRQMAREEERRHREKTKKREEKRRAYRKKMAELDELSERNRFEDEAALNGNALI